MATALKPSLATLDKAFCEAEAGLPQVSRVVAVQSGAGPSYVVTVDGDWIAEAPAVHRAVRPLRRRTDLAFHPLDDPPVVARA